MSFFSIFRKKEEKPKISLLVDIGNGTVEVALAIFSQNKKPTFLGVAKESFIIVDRPDSTRLTRDMIGILDSSLDYLMKDVAKSDTWIAGDKKINNVAVSFSSPWFVSETKHIHMSKPDSFSITESLLSELVMKESATFTQDLQGGSSADNIFDVIEKNITNMKLNGYNSSNPLEQKTKDLEISVCLSAILKDLSQKVDDTILKYIHISKEDISMHTFPMVCFSVISQMFSPDEDFIAIDVTSEVTDVSVIKSGSIVASASFPLGRNLIVRQISKAFNSNSEIAESNLHMYMEKKADTSVFEKVNQVLLNTEKEWEIYFKNIISDLSPSTDLPKKVYITADSDAAMIFVDFLSLPKQDATSAFRKNLTINYLNNESMKSFYESSSTGEVDEFIAMLAVFQKSLFYWQ